MVLRPSVTVTAADMVDTAAALHDRAHELCFIASSVNFPVRCEPATTVGLTAARRSAGPLWQDGRMSEHEAARQVPEIITVPRRPTDEQRPATPEQTETISSPAKVMRIGSMVRQLLEEVRHAPLDEAGRARLREIYDISVQELASSLSPDLAAELDRITLPLEQETPSEAELRVAQAQLVGWLEGLFHGIQATLFAQQMAARNQLAEMRGRGLPGPGGARPGEDERSLGGTYL